jgi:hypothetical protein
MILDKLDKITLEPRGVYPPSPPHDPGHLSALVHPHHAEQPPLPRPQALDLNLNERRGLLRLLARDWGNVGPGARGGDRAQRPYAPESSVNSVALARRVDGRGCLSWWDAWVHKGLAVYPLRRLRVDPFTMGWLLVTLIGDSDGV